MEKKSQIWFTDFIIGVMIFLIVVLIYYGYSYSLNSDPGDITKDLIMEAKSISSALISRGSPSDWNKSNVEVIGLTDGNQRIVEEKLGMFAEMDYEETRDIFRTPYDYHFFLKEANGSIVDENGEIGLSGNSSDNLVSITRIVIYDSRLVNMVVHVWD
ncbi:hypothetical protein GF336_04200 [Candidatus Woesearchaeota archaeon]|nr:hypothetical protein [Candidatus Woesearchaeota archaeon]